PAAVAPPAVTGELSQYFDLTAGILRAASAHAVIASAALVARCNALRPSCPDLMLVLAPRDLNEAALDDEPPPSIDDLALVQFTSGSTSSPKGIALTHRNLAANIDAINGP